MPFMEMEIVAGTRVAFSSPKLQKQQEYFCDVVISCIEM